MRMVRFEYYKLSLPEQKQGAWGIGPFKWLLCSMHYAPCYFSFFSLFL